MNVKKTVSAFLAGIMAVATMLAGSVTAGAADSAPPYSVEYQPALTLGTDGETKEALLLCGLTLEEYQTYVSFLSVGGQVLFGIRLDDSTSFFYGLTGSSVVAWAVIDGESTSVFSEVNPIISTTEEMRLALIFDKNKLSDAVRKRMRSAKTCTVSIGAYTADDTFYNYRGVSVCDADFSVAGDSASSVSSLSASVKDQTYTGKARTPDVTITDGSKTLKKGTDYTLSYKNNKKIGTATVTVKGKGDYSGTKTLTFQIVPKKTTLAAKKSGEKIALSWDSVKGAEKYQIYYREKGEMKYKKLATVSGNKTSYSTSKLDKNKTYQFKIRSYAAADGKKYYGGYSKVVTVQ